MNPSGKVEILDNKGIIITDQSLIRKVKATNSYKSIVKNMEYQRQERYRRHR